MSISYVNGLPVFDEEYCNQVFELIPEAVDIYIRPVSTWWIAHWRNDDVCAYYLGRVHNSTGIEHTIERKWKPKRFFKYWAVCFGAENNVLELTWTDEDADKQYHAKGLCFKTAEEAVACSKKMLEAINK